MKRYWKLEIQMIFALRESLARSDLAKGMSMAEKTVSVPAMTRKHVQKPGNISEQLFQNLSGKETMFLIEFEQGFLAFKLEKLRCPFRTNPNQATKRLEFKLNVPMGLYRM